MRDPPPAPLHCEGPQGLLIPEHKGVRKTGLGLPSASGLARLQTTTWVQAPGMGLLACWGLLPPHTHTCMHIPERWALCSAAETWENPFPAQALGEHWSRRWDWPPEACPAPP